MVWWAWPVGEHEHSFLKPPATLLSLWSVWGFMKGVSLEGYSAERTFLDIVPSSTHFFGMNL